MDREVAAKAAAVAAAIKETELYRAWVKAREDVAQRHAAQVMLRDLRAVEAELMRKAEAGETPTPEEQERWQRTVETVSYNPYVRAVLETDMALAQLLAEVQQVIARELGLAAETAPGDPGAGASGAGAPGAAGSGQGPAAGVAAEAPAPSEPPEPPRRSRLWVPGQP